MNCCRRAQKTGQSLVEFALVLPVLLPLLFVIIELGTVFSVYIGLTNSAREVARAGSMYHYDGDLIALQSAADPIGTVDTARATYMASVLDKTLNPAIDTTRLGTPVYTYQPVGANGVKSKTFYRYGDKLTVTLTYNYQWFTGYLGANITLAASSEMRIEPGGR